MMYTLGNTPQITQRGRHDISQYFKGNQVADQRSAITKFTAVLSIPFLLTFSMRCKLICSCQLQLHPVFLGDRYVKDWNSTVHNRGSEFLWPGSFHERLHISSRQYARLARDWVKSIGLESSHYGNHSMRRTKVAQIYRKTGNLRALQLLLGHTKMDSTVRYLGVELEDAQEIAEGVEI